MAFLDKVGQAINPFDGEQPFFDAVENLLPGDNPLLNFVEDVVDPFDGSHPIAGAVGNALGGHPATPAHRPGGTAPGGTCPLDCYQTCQAKNRSIDEQARKSIEHFYESMKARGTIITGCKVRSTVKSCGLRRPARKSCKPKATCRYVPKKKSCGCGK
jgi:hypothetical protein